MQTFYYKVSKHVERKSNTIKGVTGSSFKSFFKQKNKGSLAKSHPC